VATLPAKYYSLTYNPTLPSIPTKSLFIPRNHKVKTGHKHMSSEKKKLQDNRTRNFLHFAEGQPARPIYKRATAKHQI